MSKPPVVRHGDVAPMLMRELGTLFNAYNELERLRAAIDELSERDGWSETWDAINEILDEGGQ